MVASVVRSFALQIATVIFLLPSVASALPGPIVIDFELTSDGQVPLEGEDASAMWDAEGVSIYLAGTLEPPVIATEGWPTQGYVWRDAADNIFRDQAVSGVNTLTDPWSTDGAAELGISFAMPVDSVAITMLDFGDCTGPIPAGDPISLSLEAFDEDGVLVDSDTFTIIAYEPRDPSDGNDAELVVTAPSIAWVETSGAVGACGISYDALTFTLADADEDGVLAVNDLCPETITDADAGVPSRWLGRNRWADLDGDGQFESGWGWGSYVLSGLDMEATGGCSCTDIIDTLGLGRSAEFFGCHTWVMAWWSWFVVP